jgi:UrcA family protein
MLQRSSRLISLIAVGVFGGVAATADQVGHSISSKTVSFGDLNLSTVQGQQIARQRVHQLASALCTRVADPTDMSHHTNYLACIDATEAKASVSLQAIVEKRSSAQFARTNVK